MNFETNRFNYYLNKFADPSFNISIKEDQLILSKTHSSNEATLEERIRGVVNFLNSHKTPLNPSQLKLVQTIKGNFSTAISTQNEEMQKALKPYLDQLDHLGEHSNQKPVEISLQIAPPPTNRAEFESNLHLVLTHFPRYQLYNDLSVYDSSFHSLPKDWDFEQMFNALNNEFKKYERLNPAEMSALKADILNLLKVPTPIQMGIIIEHSPANTTNYAMLTNLVDFIGKGVPCVLNRHFFQAQAGNFQRFKSLNFNDVDVYVQKKGTLCVIIPKGKTLAEFGFNSEGLELSRGEHLKPLKFTENIDSDISSLLISENEKQRFFRFVAFSGHGTYAESSNDLASKSSGIIAGLPSLEFQKTLAALKDKNLAFMALSSCYSGGTNICDIHLPDNTIPCPIYVESSFDRVTIKVIEGVGHSKYDETKIVGLTKVLDEAQKMLMPSKEPGTPRQLFMTDRKKLSRAMNYASATYTFSNLGSLLLPTNAREIPKVAYALANPEDILDISRAHKKNEGPLEDKSLNRKGYLLSDPVVDYPIHAAGELPMILLSRGGSAHHIMKEVAAPQQSLEEIAKETFNAFKFIDSQEFNEPGNKVFYIANLRCRYEGKEAALKKVMIRNSPKEREVLFQMEGERGFRKLCFKHVNTSAYSWAIDGTKALSRDEGLQEIYKNAAESAPSPEALLQSAGGRRSERDFIEALDAFFFGQQMPEQAKFYSALLKDRFQSPDQGANLKLALNEMQRNTPSSFRREHLKIMREAIQLAEKIKLAHLGKMINEASYTPLMKAIKEGDREKAKAILQAAPYMLEDVDANGSTALIIALSKQDFEMAVWLIEQGADLYCTDSYEQSPIRLLCASAGPKSMAAILPRFSDLKGSKGAELLALSLEAKNWQMAHFLIDHQAGIEAAQTKPPLIAQALMNSADKDIINKLLKYPRMDINQPMDERGDTVLHLAVANADVEVVKLLLEHGANPNGSNLNQDSPLSYVALHRKGAALAKVLIEAGAQLNAQNAAGQTPLHLAIHFEDKPLIEFLICRGASLSIKEKQRNSNPLEQAWLQKPQLLEFILQIPGIDINPLQGNLNKLFQQAIWRRQFKSASLLLLHGAKINEPPVSHYLSPSADSLAVVQFFAEHGADLTQQDYKGDTVMHWAMENQNLELFKYLKELKVPYDKPVNNKGMNPFMAGLSDKPNKHFLEELLNEKDLQKGDVAEIVSACLSKWGVGHPEAIAVLMKKAIALMDENDPNIRLYQALADRDVGHIQAWLKQSVQEVLPSFYGIPTLELLFYLGFESEERTRDVIISLIDQFPQCIPLGSTWLAKDLLVLKALIKKGAEIDSEAQYQVCDLELIKLLEGRGVDLSGWLGKHYLRLFLSNKYNGPDQKEGIIELCAQIRGIHTVLPLPLEEKARSEYIDLLLSHPYFNSQNKNRHPFLVISCQNIDLLKKLVSKNPAFVLPRDLPFDQDALKLLMTLDEGKESDEMLEIAKILLQSGLITKINFDQVHIAITYNQERMLSLFIDQVDLKARYSDGNSYLHTAINWGALNVAELLASKGVDIHQVNNDGDTALHCLLRIARVFKEDQLLPLITLLIHKGAKWDIPNKEGLTAKQLAVKMRLGKVLQMMK